MHITVAITGAASGLGRVIATELLSRGHAVVLLDRDGEQAHAAARELSEKHGTDVVAVVADLSTIAGIHSAADLLTARGDIGALINNAGGWLPGPQYPDSEPDTWLSAIALNLLVPTLLTQRLWPTLSAASGAVVNIGSSGGLGGDSYGSPEYGASKAGIRRFTASLGSRTDVRVMSVVLGWIGLDRAHHEWQRSIPSSSVRSDRWSRPKTSPMWSRRSSTRADRAKSSECCVRVGGAAPQFASRSVPLALVFIVDGRRGLRQTWPAALVCGAVFGLAQFATSNYVSVPLADIVAALLAAVALVGFLQIWHPAESYTEGDGRVVPAVAGGSRPAERRPCPAGGAVRHAGGAVRHAVEQPDTRVEIARAYSPYLIIIAIFVVANIAAIKGVAPLKPGGSGTGLNAVTKLFAWPGRHIVSAKGDPLKPLSSSSTGSSRPAPCC